MQPKLNSLAVIRYMLIRQRRDEIIIPTDELVNTLVVVNQAHCKVS